MCKNMRLLERQVPHQPQEVSFDPEIFFGKDWRNRGRGQVRSQGQRSGQGSRGGWKGRGRSKVCGFEGLHQWFPTTVPQNTSVLPAGSKCSAAILEILKLKLYLWLTRVFFYLKCSARPFLFDLSVPSDIFFFNSVSQLKKGWEPLVYTERMFVLRVNRTSQKHWN
jgi:hypothetical protein